MSATVTQPQCPRCQADQSAYQMMGAQPSFCLECRFPLMLIAGKYPLLQILSQGNQSTVYLARHHRLKRKAERVIKVLAHDQLTSREAIQRFHREVQVTAELSQLNEHIVRIYDDFGEVPYLGYFYVMEFLEGTMLHEYLDSFDGPLPPAWALDLMLQLCEAIQVAHDNGVIHRDLKPSNLMVMERPATPLYLKVLDWGIAKTNSDGTLTQPLTEYAIGTPLYMAPEQVFNNPVDERADIYAMGILLFELLAGVNPFAMAMGLANDMTGQTNHAMAKALNAQLYQQPPKLSEAAAKGQSTPALEEIITRAMAKHPDDRYESVDALQHALEEAVSLLQFQLPSDSIQDFDISGGHQPMATPHSLDFLPASRRQKPKDDEATKPQDPPLLRSSYLDEDALQDAAAERENTLSYNDRSDTIFDGPMPPTGADEDASIKTADVDLLAAQTIEPRPGHTTLGYIQQAYPERKPPLLLWLGGAMALGALVGLFWWSTQGPAPTKTPTSRLMANSPAQPRAGAARQQPVATRGAVATGIIPAASRQPDSGPQIPKPTPQATRAPTVRSIARAAQSPPKRRRSAKRRRLYAKRARTKRIPSRRKSRPRPAAPATKSPCGAGWRWVLIQPYLGHRSEVILEGGKSQRRNAKGMCITTSTRRMSVMQQGYALCIVSPKPSPRMLHLRLKPEVGMLPADYCLKR